MNRSMSDLEKDILDQEKAYRAANLHDAHVRASGHRNRCQLLDMAFYHQIYAVPLVKPRSLP